MMKFLFFKIFNYKYKRSLAIVDVLTMFDDAIFIEVILEMQCSRTLDDKCGDHFPKALMVN